MTPELDREPPVEVDIDAAASEGPLELWRHAIGDGGINSRPLPDRVVEGARALGPRLVRVFIQEFFHIYGGHGRFDWTRLDPYLDSVGRTGAKVVAAICIKPAALFPEIDQARWRPDDPGEWQDVIRALVRRYSVERDLVSHWEVGNETDIGEDGGSPYLIPDPADYAEFYDLTVAAILDACPQVKVGGPAACWVTNEPLPGLIGHCRATNTRLDFISWHLYDDDPGKHASGVTEAKRMLEGYPGTRPELMVTEWAKSFETVSVEELASSPRRAALAAAAALAMHEAGIDWSFYYHLWDQTAYPEEFESFFSAPGVEHMLRHWNEVPHRFGLFGVGEEVRPQYFVYWMFGQLGPARVRARCSEPALPVVAAGDAGGVETVLVNAGDDAGTGRVVTLTYDNLRPGAKSLELYRIDEERRWSAETLRMRPVERRMVSTRGRFSHQIHLPADSVALVVLRAA